MGHALSFAVLEIWFVIKNKLNSPKSSINVANNRQCNKLPFLGLLLFGFFITASVLSMLETSKKTGFVQVQESMNRTEIAQLIENIQNPRCLLLKYLFFFFFSRIPSQILFVIPISY